MTDHRANTLLLMLMAIIILLVVMISRGTAEENQRRVTEQGFTFLVLVWDDAVA